MGRGLGDPSMRWPSMSVTFGTEATAPALAGRVGITRRFSQGVALG